MTALGVRVLLVAEPPLAEALRAAWSSCLTPPGGAPDAVIRAADVQVGMGQPASTGELLQRITEEVTHCAIQSRAGELLMLHACAVACPRSGDAVALVGPSGIGKTTLAATLGRRHAYVTDETVALRPDGSLVAYPKPLSVLHPEHSYKHQVSPSGLGALPSKATLRVARIVLLDRQSRLREAHLSPIPKMQAIALLAEHTSYLSALDQPLTRIARLVDGAGGLLRVRYGEAEQLLPVVDQWFGADA